MLKSNGFSKEKKINYVEKSDRLYLRPINLNDVNDKYLRWMNDAEVSQYLESRFSRHTISSLTDFVKHAEADHDTHFFAICIKKNDEHIGNIKLGPINRHHRRADVGIMIGEKKWWGNGFATEAIYMITRYAFEKLDLNKLTAGCYAVNEGSARAFEKSGWSREGMLKDHAIVQGKPHDCIQLGIAARDYREMRR